MRSGGACLPQPLRQRPACASLAITSTRSASRTMHTASDDQGYGEGRWGFSCRRLSSLEWTLVGAGSAIRIRDLPGLDWVSTLPPV